MPYSETLLSYLARSVFMQILAFSAPKFGFQPYFVATQQRICKHSLYSLLQNLVSGLILSRLNREYASILCIRCSKIWLSALFCRDSTKIMQAFSVFAAPKFGHLRKMSYLCTALCKNLLLTQLKTYYEPVRNRFHFDSRFV
jgi:hypothetical protein